MKFKKKTSKLKASRKNNNIKKVKFKVVKCKKCSSFNHSSDKCPIEKKQTSQFIEQNSKMTTPYTVPSEDSILNASTAKRNDENVSYNALNKVLEGKIREKKKNRHSPYGNNIKGIKVLTSKDIEPNNSRENDHSVKSLSPPLKNVIGKKTEKRKLEKKVNRTLAPLKRFKVNKGEKRKLPSSGSKSRKEQKTYINQRKEETEREYDEYNRW